MKGFLGLGWAAASLALAGCGSNVVVDGPAGTGTGGASTTTTSSTTNTTTSTGTVTFTSSTGTGTSTSSGGPCSMTCSEALNNGGPPPCGGNALTFYDELLMCGCSGGSNSCATSCTASFCIHEAAQGSCVTCLKINCGAELMNCVAN